MERDRQCRTDHLRRRRAVVGDVAPVLEPVAALDDLRVIRETMERSASFTAVSGRAMVVIGVTAIVAAWIAARWPVASLRWFGVWSAECLFALIASLIGVRAKAHRTGAPLLSGPARRAVLALLPGLAAGAVLTSVVAGARIAPALVPGVWLLLYGVATMGAGAFSVRPVQVMGWCFAVLGSVALVLAGQGSAWVLAGGFGGLHIIFGTWIWSEFGG